MATIGETRAQNLIREAAQFGITAEQLGYFVARRELATMSDADEARIRQMLDSRRQPAQPPARSGRSQRGMVHSVMADLTGRPSPARGECHYCGGPLNRRGQCDECQ